MTGMRLKLPRGLPLIIARHPLLVRGVWDQIRALRPIRWWASSPHLPIPDPRYWRFRLETAYGGSGDVQPRSEDVAEVLEWSHTMRRFER